MAAALVAPGLWQTFARSPVRQLRFLAFALAASLAGALAGGLFTGSALLLASQDAPHVVAQALQLGLAAFLHAIRFGDLWLRGRQVLSGPAKATLPGTAGGWLAALATILALV